VLNVIRRLDSHPVTCSVVSKQKWNRENVKWNGENINNIALCKIAHTLLKCNAIMQGDFKQM